MKNLTICCLILLGIISNKLTAEECTHLWTHTLDINPTDPKPMSGDTYAAYGLLGFYDEKNLRLQIKGDFFKGRFMSFESYKTKQKLNYDVIMDYEMKADLGSQNPYIQGVDMDIENRSYTLDLVTKGTKHVSPNVLYLAPAARIHSVFYRAYVPSDGVTISLEDLPKIYAFDSISGKPRKCPKALNTTYKPRAVTVILNFIKEKKELDFKVRSWWNGVNSAIPNYAPSLSKVKHNAVSVVKFKAPSFTRTNHGTGPFIDDGESRYWSLCIQNFKLNQTLRCLPDYLAKIDNNGFVTVVISKNKSLEAIATQRGFSFLDDPRKLDQDVLGYVYRTLLPKPWFKAYDGDYLPVGLVCDENEFISGGCEI